MNLKQALKTKNKLVAEMNDEFQKASRYNVVEGGNNRPYSSTEAIAKWIKLSEDLIAIKTKIYKANMQVYQDILLLGELKNQVKCLKSLDCSNGRESRRSWVSSENDSVVKHAEINVVERDRMVKQLEVRIETIQDMLDNFNHTTIIED